MHAMRTSYFEWLCDCLLVECVSCGYDRTPLLHTYMHVTCTCNMLSCGYDRTPLLHTAIFSKYVVVVHHRGSGTL